MGRREGENKEEIEREGGNYREMEEQVKERVRGS